MITKIQQNTGFALTILCSIIALLATIISLQSNTITLYGDAESHLNIAKKVIDSLTPGFSQLGGVWLPLPHLLMTPFVYFDFLWRTGLAGSIVSGVCFVIATLYIFKSTQLLTHNRFAALLTAAIFMLNPNVLYLQTTPMTEIPLIMFLSISVYYFIKYLLDDRSTLSLIQAAAFGFLTTLSRYDGWFLVAIECLILILHFLSKLLFKSQFKRPKIAHLHLHKVIQYKEIIEGHVILFASLAFFGIFLWFSWNFLILGDPLYFTNSEFSAKTQQLAWLQRGELPAYHDLTLSVIYYLDTAVTNFGPLLSIIALAGLGLYVYKDKKPDKLLILGLLLTPFIFNILTLYLGQSVIFIPNLTPQSFEWRLFNVRYGVMAIPSMAIIIGWLYANSQRYFKYLIIFVAVIQAMLFVSGANPTISLVDGQTGLSQAKRPDAENWLAKNYDHGLVLIDDYARSVSIIRSHIPMNQVIYIGTKPYWNESLDKPQTHAEWVIAQKDDTVWNTLIDNPIKEAELYKFYQKVYTSNEILIFKRNPNMVVTKPSSLQ